MIILSYIGIAIAAIVGAFIIYLAFVAVVPGFSVPEQLLERGEHPAIEEGARNSGTKRDATFTVKETILAARLYLPENSSMPTPCIVMAHGFGGIMDMGLELYAIRFQEAGFAVLAFDYRYFGRSGGEPRQLLWIPSQLEDWQAAIGYVRSIKEVDPARIGLWGTSLSGGHVIVVAAKDKTIACVSVQCPGVDGFASGRMMADRDGLAQMLAKVVHGQRDLVRSWLGLSPHRIPIVGKPGSRAMITTPGAFETFSKLAPDTFVNQVCARIAMRGDKYRPVNHARNVNCPVLLQICDRDEITPMSASEETARRLGENAEVIHYPLGHFDIYFGNNFEKSVNDQLAFFRKHLPG